MKNLNKKNNKLSILKTQNFFNLKFQNNKMKIKF